MDPEEALKDLRKKVEDFQTNPATKMEEAVGYALEICELFDGLDQWLTKGGSLPKAWKR